MWASFRLLAVLVGLGLPVALVGIPWSALRGDADAMYGWAMWVIRLGLRAAGVRVRVLGLEHVSAEPSILMSNHVSNLDPPVLLPSIPGMTSVMLKQELMRIPLLGMAMRMGRFVPVTRGHSREEARRSIAAAREALAHGMHITIFPEGTRSADGHLLPFRKGGFFLATETGVPVVPVVIRGTAELMRRGSLRLQAGEVTVEFLPGLRPAEFASREALMLAVRERMEAALARRGPGRGSDGHASV